MRLATALLLLLIVPPALAQAPGNCQLGTAEADLDVSDIQARLFTTGNLFYGNTTFAGDGYLVPKFTGHSPIFAAGIWIGGFVGDDLRVAGATYDDFEFWPGPLEPGATLPNPADCSDYDRIWTVSVLDVEQYDDEGVATDDLAEWPIDLGAPVIDGDGVEGNYDLEGGDRPEIYGHQTAFWVMNDVGNIHTNTLTPPIGLEVRVTAFSSAEALLRQQTVYRYEVINRNPAPFEAARFGLFVDPDLGDAADDYVGSDSTRGMAFVYNGTETDAVYGTPPAAGYDLLSGADASMWFCGCAGPIADPTTAEGLYHVLNARWQDGEPLTEGGDGYMTGGDTLTWAFPGDPVTEQFWSEVNVDGNGADNPPGDRRNVISSPIFTLQPGESRTFDLAILFAQSDDNIDSVAELQALSDAVQARYDDGELFAPSTVPFPPPGALLTPELLAPEDGTTFVDETVELSWTAVTGADGYRVEVATEPDFSDRTVRYTDETETFFYGEANAVQTYYWRVQAGSGLERSAYSDVGSFSFYRYEFDFFGRGDGIVETAYPGTDVCPGGNPTGDPGCADYGGNTVWLDPNATDDYFVATRHFLGFANPELIEGEDFELRFTEACAAFGGCLGAYIREDSSIVSVPFELWNLGDDEDPADDVRMIPMIRDNLGADPVTNWADTFTRTEQFVLSGDTLDLGVTERLFFLMPDRPNGYALFEAAANGFGGPGAVYAPGTDGDTQIDLNANGDPCSRQGWYVDFCYRALPPYRAPIGHRDGLWIADLAGDGTTPPAGTTIRFISVDRLLEVDAEDDAPAVPEAFALEAAYPNPFRSSATLAFRLNAAIDVRLAVYDVLGRRVRVLHEGPITAGAHQATFDGTGLASGVYLVVLEAGGQRQARKVMLVR